MNADDLFSWGAYAYLIREKRTKKGYTTAKKFSSAIYRRTRLEVSSDVVYRIEQCRQEPNAMQFMAINLSLFDEVFPYEVRECARGGWVDLIEHYNVPDKWKRENLLAECEEVLISGEKSISVWDDLEDENYYEVYIPRGDQREDYEESGIIATVCGLDLEP